jgi:hypothetical protein
MVIVTASLSSVSVLLWEVAYDANPALCWQPTFELERAAKAI